MRDWWLAPIIAVHEPHLSSAPAKALLADGSSAIFVRSRQLVARNPILVNMVLVCEVLAIVLLGFSMERLLRQFQMAAGRQAALNNSTVLEQFGVSIKAVDTLKTGFLSATNGAFATAINAYLFERLLRSV